MHHRSILPALLDFGEHRFLSRLLRSLATKYDITSIEQAGIVPIQRIVTDNVALCDLLGGL